MSAPISADTPRSVARRFSRLTLAYTLFVVLFGAVVRITGSGAGCGQHWPTCNGEVAHLPRSLETAIELTHRVTSGLAFAFVVGLLVVTFRERPAGHAARRLAAWAVIMMIVEALIGASLVLGSLVGQDASAARAVVMPVHLVSTYALTAVLTLLAVFRDVPLRTAGSSARTLLIVSGLALVLVSATGALTALGDTLYPPATATLGDRLAEDQGGGAHFLMRLRVLHPMLAVLAGVLVVRTARKLGAASPSPRLRAVSRALVGLVLAQLSAGVLNVFLSAPGWLQIVHLALALGLWIALVILGYEEAVAEAPVASARPHPS